MSAFLSLHDLSLKTPDGRPLVRDLTLAFGAERTGIVGANGSGKSTLLAAMSAGGPHVSHIGTCGLFDQRLDPAQSVPEALGATLLQSRSISSHRAGEDIHISTSW